MAPAPWSMVALRGPGGILNEASVWCHCAHSSKQRGIHGRNVAHGRFRIYVRADLSGPTWEESSGASELILAGSCEEPGRNTQPLCGLRGAVAPATGA